MSTLLALEPLIAARLRELIDRPEVKILTLADLASLQESAQPVPAVHLVYDGHTVNINEMHTEIVERYLTVIAVRNVRDQKGGADARAAAAPLLNAVFAALNGWVPAGHKPLRAATPPRPGYKAGFGYHPLAWEARLKRIPHPCPTL